MTEANQEILNSLIWKADELYYALSTDTKKNSIRGSEDINMNLNGGIIVMQSEKFEENEVIVKSISIKTNPKFALIDACEESEDSFSDFLDFAEESDIEDEPVTQSKLDDLVNSFIIHKKLF